MVNTCADIVTAVSDQILSNALFLKYNKRYKGFMKVIILITAAYESRNPTFHKMKGLYTSMQKAEAASVL